MARVIWTVLIALLLSGFAFGALGVTAWADPIGDHPIPEVATGDRLFPVLDDQSIVHSHPLHVDSWSRNPSDDSLSVQFSLPSPDCSGVHADVHETADWVAVELREGTHPQSVGRMCTMIVVSATLDVTLQAPLGDRTVLSTF